MAVAAQTPEFGTAAALRAGASNWRISGILNARSGSWLTVSSGRDNMFNGMANQWGNEVSDDVYGPDPDEFCESGSRHPEDSVPTSATASRDRGSTRWIWRCRVSYP